MTYQIPAGFWCQPLVTGGGGGGECDDYAWAIPTAIVTNLTVVPVFQSPTAIETNLCAEVI